jgi:3-phenylpropionate/trans-cinnamate dioxygenase ferredoxin subunit
VGKLGFVKVAETSDIPVGKMKMVKLGDKEILISNVDGNYYAIADRCTHKGGDLSKGSLDVNIVTCPVHGARFDVTTGKAISPPKILFFKAKTNDEPSYEVKIENKDVMLKEDNIISSSDEKREGLSEEENVEPPTETKKKRRHYLWYLPFGFLVIVGSLVMLKDLYDLYGWLQSLSSYQMSFWDLEFEYKFEFFVSMLRSLSLGIAQIVIGWLLYVYSKNKR